MRGLIATVYQWLRRTLGTVVNVSPQRDGDDASSRRRVDIPRSSEAATPGPHDAPEVLDAIDLEYLRDLEDRAIQSAQNALDAIAVGRNRTQGDDAFGEFRSLLVEYLERGFGHRIADVARERLIPMVLDVEAERRIEFHKGALFYNTALAHLVIGDEPRFMYFLAMTDEEEVRTEQALGRTFERGTTTRREGPLSQETLAPQVEFAIELLNGRHSSFAATFQGIFGTPLDLNRFTNWSGTLDDQHHAELFRWLREAEVFLRGVVRQYDRVRTHPYIVLRLAKSLAHAAQWTESMLTQMQPTPAPGSKPALGLSAKFNQDSDFDALRKAAGGPDAFVGNCPKGPDVDTELGQLLVDAATTSNNVDREWRLLRVLYIVRNATAHEIDEALRCHTDRAFVEKLLQAVFLAYFVIAKHKNGFAP